MVFLLATSLDGSTKRRSLHAIVIMMFSGWGPSYTFNQTPLNICNPRFFAVPAGRFNAHTFALGLCVDEMSLRS